MLEVAKFMESIEEEAGSADESVAAKWADVLSCDPDLIDRAVPRTAYSHLSLRQFYPMVGHGVLFLRRSTRWPYARDVATAYPLFKGGYRVFRDSDLTELGEVDTVEEAYALIAAHLPDDCGRPSR